jgi:hypothetical protein
MARAYASTVIEAPVEAVWEIVRDFNAMPSWNPNITESRIENGLAADVVGCVRDFRLADDTRVRERLLALDDSRYFFTYNFETPAFPVENYHCTLELIPVTTGDAERTFAHWCATFDEAPEDRGRYEKLISDQVFALGLNALAERAAGRTAPEHAERWQGFRPAKVYTVSVLEAPVDAVWDRLRDFAGMDGFHEDITEMTMLEGDRGDRVGGVRDFLFGAGQLWEQLTYMSDAERAFRYKILKSPNPWLNYHSGPRLHPITDRNGTLGIWTADWVASPQDDLNLIPKVHHNVFRKAFETLDTQLAKR